MIIASLVASGAFMLAFLVLGHFSSKYPEDREYRDAQKRREAYQRIHEQRKAERATRPVEPPTGWKGLFNHFDQDK